MAADASSSKAATPSKESGSSQPPFRPPAGLPAGLGSTPSRKVMPLRKHRKTTALDRHRQWIHRIKQHQQRALQHNEQEVDTNLQHKERVRRFARNLRKQILSGADTEEEELLSFAEDLDYDDYIKSLGDAELAEVLKEMKGAEEGGAGGDGKAWRKHFVRAMNHMAGWEAQGAAGRAACASVRSAAARSEAAESSITKLTESGRLKQQQAADKLAALQATKSAAEPVWDSSTKAGSDDVGVMAKVAKVHEAGEVLRENPEMRGVHSQASVAALLAKSASPATSQHASAQPVAVS
ncbi:hypothetical protein WJX72_001394 [[Myrmecia] bisecta]|uniref:Uncharacterized protein n=1 Tax=[Myrmecia] bisecta TaxID=41462 RepID=A0AAW1PZT3_9CHLO